jgi:hypothetical protein
MPLDPDRVKEASDKAQSLSKRFDAFLERRKADAEDDVEDEDEEEYLDPSAELPPSEKRPWFWDAEPREELRQGALSKGD